MTTVGSLCSGYGGLDLATETAFNARTVWHSENEPAPSRVLAHRWPGVPNLGDLTAVDWADVEPVDVMTAGYPCQPFSHAGQRKGTDDERHLWPYVAAAIRGIRPRHVVLENVAGHRTLGFDTVLGDLAAAGYDAQWTSVRAADVGAPHGRERIFIVAVDTRHGTGGTEHGQQPAFAPFWAGESGSSAATDTAHVGHERGGAARRGGAGSADRRGTAADTERSRRDGWARQPIRGPVGGTAATGDRPVIDWGNYQPAIRRWERRTRPAPAPTEPAPRGGHRLSPRFVEWMMGLSSGWVTDVPNLTRSDQLRMLGNGVVPQQAHAALCWLLNAAERAA